MSNHIALFRLLFFPPLASRKGRNLRVLAIQPDQLRPTPVSVHHREELSTSLSRDIGLERDQGIRCWQDYL